MKGGTSSTDPQPAKQDNVAAAASSPNEKTFELLKAADRRVLRNVGDAITTLKTMFAQSKDAKFMGQVHEETSKLIPRFSTLYKKTEGIVTEGSDAEDATALLAFAKKIDEGFEAYNEVSGWFKRMQPPVVKIKKEKQD